MTLNSSGPLSIGGTVTGQSIEIELGQSGTAQASLNDTALRNLAGVYTGAISFSNFYGKTKFAGATRLYTSGSGTETIPTGASTVVIEVWGGGSGGCKGLGVGCATEYGSAGGSGGYVRSSYSVAGLGGETMAYSVGAGSAGGAVSSTSAGGSSTATSGTFSITGMTGSGAGGASNSGSGGSGGSASGGNQANTSGNAGATYDGSGAAGSAVVGNGGAAYGGGGAAGYGSANSGQAASNGAVKFTYS